MLRGLQRRIRRQSEGGPTTAYQRTHPVAGELATHEVSEQVALEAPLGLPTRSHSFANVQCRGRKPKEAAELWCVPAKALATDRDIRDSWRDERLQGECQKRCGNRSLLRWSST
eukprot:s5_g67.t1